MRRRRFVRSLGAAALAGAGVARGSGEASAAEKRAFYSSSSLLNASQEKLTDENVIAVWAEDSASNENTDYAGDAVDYGDTRIPVMAVDDGVVGVGSTLVADGKVGTSYGNVAFYLDLWDQLVDGSTVLWDEGHDQYWTLDKFSTFESAASDRGYDLRATDSLADDLPGAAGAVVMPPRWEVTGEDLSALADHASSGAVFLHDQSDYFDYDQTDRLNAVCDRLGAGFRFNDDRVVDAENNAGANYQPVTDELNDALPVFGGGGGGGDNRAPTATFSVEGEPASVGDRLTFDSAGSSDGDGRVTGYDWDFGDGTTATGWTVTHSYGQAGEYTVSLTVTDDDGATATAEQTVTVEPEVPEDREVVKVTDVADGDTVQVMYQGSEESIRMLGTDTPEVPQYDHFERPPEWEGIDSLSTLNRWGKRASAFAKERIKAGDRVEIEFDENTDKFDGFGRLLAYVYYDSTGDGSRDSFYNRELVESGMARVYGGTATVHDDFWLAEQQARDRNRGVWADATPRASSRYRNNAVEELFVPEPAPVTTTDGSTPDSRAAVYAGESATVTGGSVDGDPALVAADETAGVGVVGGLIVNESYELEEDYPVDTSGYGNFTLLTNLIDHLSAKSGEVLIDGSHGQFAAEWALSNEDAAYYQRHLEGFGIDFDQFNDLADPPEPLTNYRAIVVTPPKSGFSAAERSALRSFQTAGGAVVLIGGADATGAARKRLNGLAESLGTDLRLGSGSVRDPSNNLNADPAVPVTANFDDSFPLFEPYSDPGLGGGGGGGSDPGTSTESYEGRLASDDGSAVHYHQTKLDDPTEAVVSLSGPRDADFDLYVTVDGRRPTVYDYDVRSWNYGSQEEIRLDDGQVDGDTELGILVDSYSGSGDYTLTVEESG